MAESELDRDPGKDTQALYQLGALLELVLDQGHPAFVLHEEYATWQVLLGNPEGPIREMTRFGPLDPDVVCSMMRQTVEGLNLRVINGETYRFARVAVHLNDIPATIFVPG